MPCNAKAEWARLFGERSIPPMPAELAPDMAGDVADIEVGVIILTEFFKAADSKNKKKKFRNGKDQL